MPGYRVSHSSWTKAPMSRLPVLCDFKYLCSYLSPVAATVLSLVTLCMCSLTLGQEPAENSPHICLNTTLHTNTSGQSPPFQWIIPLVVLLYHPKLQFMFPQRNGTRVHCLSSTSLSQVWKMAPTWRTTVHAHICLYSNRDCSLHYLLPNAWKQLPWAFGPIS